MTESIPGHARLVSVTQVPTPTQLPTAVSPTPVAAPARRLYSVRKASDLMGMWGVCFAIYGPPGSGKSTLAAQAADCPYAGKVGVIDAEGGARAYGHRDDIDVFSVRDSDDTHTNGMGYKAVLQILDDLVAKKLRPDMAQPYSETNRYGTIIVDNCSEINAFCMYDVLRTVSRQIKPDDRPDQKDWNTTTSRMLLLFRRFRDFAQESGTNVVFIAWDRQQEDKVTGVAKKDLAFNPALANQMPGLVDMVAYLTIDKRGVRKLSFEASLSTAAKFRRNPTEVAMTIPGEFIYEFASKHLPMKDLLSTLKGGQRFPEGRYKTVGGPVLSRAAALPTHGTSSDPVRGEISG